MTNATAYHLQMKRDPDADWETLSIAPVIDMPGHGPDAARRKAADTLDRYRMIHQLAGYTAFRIISDVELLRERGPSALLQLGALAICAVALAHGLALLPA